MSTLIGKNILLISPSFFGYEKEIVKQLQAFGLNVHFIDDRINNDTLTKSIIRLGLSRRFLAQKFKTYFINELQKPSFEKVDFVLAISPEGFSREIVLEYRRYLPNTKFILYMWDSLKNKKNAIDSLSLYDLKFSFDLEDKERYNLNFLPLFYIDDYKNQKVNLYPKYKFCFIGTAHSDRVELVNKIVKNYNRDSKYTYLYIQSRWLFLYNKLTNVHFKDINFNDVNFNSLSKEKTVELINESEIIIDIHHPDQIGLTMRQIEMIGARKKVITTNQNVINYDFYNPVNILVIDRNNPVIPDKFVLGKYLELDHKVYEKYSLSHWLNSILN